MGSIVSSPAPPAFPQAPRTLQQALDEVLRRTKGAFPSRRSEASSAAVKGEWTTEAWLDSLPLADVIVGALVRPLGDGSTAEQHLAFLRELGRQREGESLVLHLLQSDEGALLRRLSAALWRGVEALCTARAATARELQQKFIDEGEVFTMSYGGIETFFGGLERLLGPPSPQLAAAMHREHCSSADSAVPFTTANYGVTTTSQIEYHFVVDPEDSLGALGLSAWPAEEVRGAGVSAREAKALSAFEAAWADVDEKLEGQNEYPLREEEFLGARLYTGPMFTKYNACLRGVGIPALQPRFDELCMGNRYTTTLHVINSAVVKLGKLQRAEKVYRGMSGGVLPETFWTASDKNVRGGCEYGFLSTTTQGDVALQYAAQDGTNAGILFEIQMGMIDRGASLSWLSQYPAEEEILFAPLTGLELLSSRVVGSVLLVEVRLSVNLMNRTIEQVVAKMQTSAIGLVELISDDLRFNGAPPQALEPFEVLETICESREPEYFHVSDNYKRAVKMALDEKANVLSSLTRAEVWAAERGSDAEVAHRQRACALLAAREADHESAALLLRLSLTRQPLPAAAAAAVAAAAAASPPADGKAWVLEVVQLCVADGCLAPWPATVVDLLSREAGEPAGGTLRAAGALLSALLDGEPRGVGREVLLFEAEHEMWRAGRVVGVQPELDPPAYAVRVGAATVRRAAAELFIPDDKAGAGALLREAAAAGQTALVAELLRLGVPVGSVTRAANSALHRAASAGREAACRLLVDARADPFLLNATQASAYEEAVRGGHARVRRIFRPEESDADVTARAAGGSALLRAAARGDANALHAELARGAAAAAEGAVENGVTPLMLAARGGHLSEAKVLLASGAHVNARSARGATPLLMAAEEGHAALVELCLREGALVDLPTASGATPLMQAAAFGHAEAVERLLRARAAPDAVAAAPPDGRGGVAIVLACEGGGVRAIRLLLDARAAVDAKLADGTTGLMVASTYGHTEAVQEMLEAGCAVDLTDAHGDTSLVRACREGFDETARALLHARADVNTSCAHGYTALIVACHFGHVHSARTVLAEHALVDLVDHAGMSALMHACLYPHLTDDDLVKLLLKERADVRLRCANGDQPLHIAAASRHDEATRALLNAGAPPDAVGAGGLTPLMIAAAAGFESITSLLLSAGAAVDACGGGEGGYSPLMLASRYGHLEVIRQLLEARASPLLAAPDGKTALELAREGGHSLEEAALLNALRPATAELPPAGDGGAPVEKSSSKGAGGDRASSKSARGWSKSATARRSRVNAS